MLSLHLLVAAVILAILIAKKLTAAPNATKTLLKDPRVLDRKMLEGQRLFSQGKHDEGLQIIDSAVRADYKDPDAFFLLGYLYFQASQRTSMRGEACEVYLSNAIKNYIQALTLRPDFMDVLVNLAVAHSADCPQITLPTEDNKYAPAILIRTSTLSEQIYHTILSHSTSAARKHHAAAHYNLGNLILDRDHSRSLKHYQQAVRLSSGRHLKALLAHGFHSQRAGL
jgi:tetratricopeptide (TPR) repeat protein